MFSKIGFGKAGTQVSAIALLGLAFASSVTSAETVITVNDVAIDSSVLDVYMASRAQKPLEQVTIEERAALVEELTDLYVLATDERAKAVEKDPDIAAQLALQRVGILAQSVATEMASEIEISEEEIVKAYEQQILIAPDQQYKARHILVETQGQAIALIEQLNGGADFAELATTNSTGPSGPSGGDLGWFTDGQMVQPFSEAVAALEDGRYTTDPVQTQFGWHVILREGSRAAEPPPLEGARETISAQLQQEKLRAKIDALKIDAVK